MGAAAVRISSNHSLRELNTFAVAATAGQYIELHDDSAITQALEACGGDGPELILGGGSNVLLTRSLPGTVLRVVTQGVHCLAEDRDTVVIEVAAGVNWHELVLYTVSRGWFGLENLALIPGTVGACPIQNIGAYGCELHEHFLGLTACNLANGRLVDFSLNDCQLAYRSSVFKRADHQHWLILRVRLQLLRRPSLRLEYGEVRGELARAGKFDPTGMDVAQAVMTIRRRKLPDPAQLGNAGSFFKNPIVPRLVAAELADRYPGLPVYSVQSGEELPGDAADSRKLSAAWLIEACGWKGHREADAGVYAGHALILVNHGQATGAQLLALARRIQESVFQRFAVTLEIEPRVV